MDLTVNRDSEGNIGSTTDGPNSTDLQSYKLRRKRSNSGPGSRPDTPVGEKVHTTDFRYSKQQTIDFDRQEADGGIPVRKPKKPRHNFGSINLKNDMGQGKGVAKKEEIDRILDEPDSIGSERGMSTIPEGSV